MDIFKFSRGHFFGILIPGSFFVMNIFILYPHLIEGLDFTNISAIKENGYAAFAILFIISYVLGIGLRLLSPDFIDSISIIVRFPVFCVKYVYSLSLNKLKTNLQKNKRISEQQVDEQLKESENKSFTEILLIDLIWGHASNRFKENMRTIIQKFPYSRFLFEHFLKKTGNPHETFYERILKDEFYGKYENFTKDNINHYKIFVFSKSPSLSDEIMYQEGLVRFLSGIIYSLMIILILMSFHFHENCLLFQCYLVILIVFLYRHRNIRVKEALAVLDSYMYLKQEEENQIVNKSEDLKK